MWTLVSFGHLRARKFLHLDFRKTLTMFCPQCGIESTAGQQFCRNCGANLKVIGKAVALSEAVARSDRGPLPRIKEMVKNFKVEHVTEEVEKALDKMNTEIAKISPEHNTQHHREAWLNLRRKRSPEERRERLLTNGLVSLFSGAGLTLFLYYLSGALVLKLPPEVLAKIPFEVNPVVHIIWLLGMIPILSGTGRIISALLIKPSPPDLKLEHADVKPLVLDTSSQRPLMRGSVTDRTTELLERES